MEWVKLYTDLPDHPKVMGLSDRAFRAYVTLMCYAGRYETDGLIPEPTAAHLAEQMVELEAAGLAEQLDGEWRLHGFAKRQRSAAAMRELRDAGRDRQRRLRSRNAVTNAVSNGHVTLTEREVEGEKAADAALILRTGVHNSIPALAREGDEKTAAGDRIAAVLLALLGRALSPLEIERVRSWPFSLWRLSEEEITDACREVEARYRGRGARIGSVALFEGRLGDLMAAKVDATSKLAGGLTKVGSVLGGDRS